MIQKIKSKLIPIVAIATLIYLLSLIYFDSSLLFQSISTFPIEKLILILLLISLTFISKFLRWHYYLTVSCIKIPIKDSILIFTSGLLMSISPGKIGEFLKSYLVKSKFKIPMSKTNSVVLAERIIEFLALIIIHL